MMMCSILVPIVVSFLVELCDTSKVYNEHLIWNRRMGYFVLVNGKRRLVPDGKTFLLMNIGEWSDFKLLDDNEMLLIPEEVRLPSFFDYGQANGDVNFDKEDYSTLPFTKSFTGFSEKMINKASNPYSDCRLIPFVSKLLRGERVVVLIVGGSISAGVAWTGPQRPRYSELLEKHLNVKYPTKKSNESHFVINKAVPATSSSWAVSNLVRIASNLPSSGVSSVAEVDLILVEYAVNDFYAGDHIGTAESTELLILASNKLFPNANLLWLELFSNDQKQPKLHRVYDEPRVIDGSASAQSDHFMILRHFEIPWLSLRDALFPEYINMHYNSSSEWSREHWIAFNDQFHPNSAGHSRIADFISAYVNRIALLLRDAQTAATSTLSLCGGGGQDAVSTSYSSGNGTGSGRSSNSTSGDIETNAAATVQQHRQHPQSQPSGAIVVRNSTTTTPPGIRRPPPVLRPVISNVSVLRVWTAPDRSYLNFAEGNNSETIVGEYDTQVWSWRADVVNKLGWIFDRGGGAGGGSPNTVAHLPNTQSNISIPKEALTSALKSVPKVETLTFNVSVGSLGIIVIGYLRSYDAIMGDIMVDIAPLRCASGSASGSDGTTTIINKGTAAASDPSQRSLTVGAAGMGCGTVFSTVLHGWWPQNVSLVQTAMLDTNNGCRMLNCVVAFTPVVIPPKPSSLPPSLASTNTPPALAPRRKFKLLFISGK